MNLTFGEIKKLFPKNTLAMADDVPVAGINRDSRTIRPGEIFAAIRGDKFDGHDFIDAALAAGATAALVDKPGLAGKNLVMTDDVVRALGTLAGFYRQKFTQPVIAVTGSNGKTTTKEFLAHVLGLHGKVQATQGNLNNHIGVPLTFFGFDGSARYFVVEMGMSHFGEIRYLAQITRPTLALITSVGRAHLEGVGGTLDGVARAKGELFAELDENATAFVFADDPYIRKMDTRAQRITYGFTPGCDYCAADVVVAGHTTRFVIHSGPERYQACIGLVGRQHVQNALVVFAVATTLGVPTETILQGLESFRIDFNRGRRLEIAGMTVIDDSYNANPESMRAALDAFCEEFADVYKVAALGGMLELGTGAVGLHREVGAYCRKRGVADILAYGANGKDYLQGFGYGPTDEATHCFSDHQKLAARLRDIVKVRGRIAVLLKGSRGMTMETVLEYIK